LIQINGVGYPTLTLPSPNASGFLRFNVSIPEIGHPKNSSMPTERHCRCSIDPQFFFTGSVDLSLIADIYT